MEFVCSFVCLFVKVLLRLNERVHGTKMEFISDG
jgi:hypothetical protein